MHFIAHCFYYMTPVGPRGGKRIERALGFIWRAISPALSRRHTERKSERERGARTRGRPRGKEKKKRKEDQDAIEAEAVVEEEQLCWARRGTGSCS